MIKRTVLQISPLIRAFLTQTPMAAAARRGSWCAAVVVLLSLAVLPLPVAAEEAPRGPDVVIIAGKDRVVYEFRQNGELRMVRVVPKWGKPYYLVPRDDTRGYGDLERADMLLPQWVIAEF